MVKSNQIPTSATGLSSEFLKKRVEFQLGVLGYFINNANTQTFAALATANSEDFDFPYNKFYELAVSQFTQYQSLDLEELFSKVPSIPLSALNAHGDNITSFAVYVRKIKKVKETKRIMQLVYLTQRAQEDTDSFSQIVEEIVRLNDGLDSGDWKSAEQVLQEELTQKKRTIHHIYSKYPTINELVYSYKSGDLHIIAARPGVGKTTFLLNEAVHIAQQGIHVGFITLEMPAGQCMRRVVSMLSGIEFKQMYDDNVFVEAIKQSGADKLPLSFYEDYSCEYLDVVAKIRKIVAKGTKVVFIDQLSHIKHNSKAYSKTDAIEQTVRALKTVAMELNIIIIMAVQINRQSSQAEQPDLEHLKDSGSIEEASQLVVMLQRKDNGLKAYIRKATHGKLGSFELNFFADTCKVEEGQAVTIKDIAGDTTRTNFKATAQTVPITKKGEKTMEQKEAENKKIVESVAKELNLFDSEKEAKSRKEKELESRKDNAESRKLVFERYGEELKLFGITDDDYSEEADGETFTQNHDYYKPVCF